MADALEFEVVTPERALVHEQVASVQAPALNGYVGILPGHAPLLAELGIGQLTYEAGGKQYVAFMGGLGRSATIVGPNDAKVDNPPLLFVFELDGNAPMPAAAPVPPPNAPPAPAPEQRN